MGAAVKPPKRRWGSATRRLESLRPQAPHQQSDTCLIELKSKEVLSTGNQSSMARDGGRRMADTKRKRAGDNTAGKQALRPDLDKHKWQPGVSANPKGRPKGSRNKLGEAFLSDLQADWEL